MRRCYEAHSGWWYLCHNGHELASHIDGAMANFGICTGLAPAFHDVRGGGLCENDILAFLRQLERTSRTAITNQRM